MLYNFNKIGLDLFINEINNNIKNADRTIVSLHSKDVTMTSTLNREADKVSLTYSDYGYKFLNFEFEKCHIGMLSINDDIEKIEYKNEAYENVIEHYHKIYLRNSYILFTYYFDDEEEALNKKIYEDSEE